MILSLFIIGFVSDPVLVIETLESEIEVFLAILS